MKRAVAIRHVHFEDLGVFEPALHQAGFETQTIDATSGDLRATNLDAADLVFFLGGPIGAYEEGLYPFLKDELALIERRLKSGRPVIGVCLGAQLMARALGARVYSSGIKEIGWSTLSLTEAGQGGPCRHLGGGPVLHWHGDTFDMPEGATHLASTEVCPNQAFGYGTNALGLQFHAEADPAHFERWLVGHACEIAGAGLSVGDLRAATAEFAPGCATRAHEFLFDWLGNVFAPHAKAVGG